MPRLGGKVTPNEERSGPFLVNANLKTNQAGIGERLAGQEILVTGVTGFLAKVFVEKLLRSVPAIGRLHLLIRPRSDGMSPEERARREVFGSSAFDRLRAALGHGFETRCGDKVCVVGGDLTLPHFGLDDEAYRALAERVTMIVNSAATVTFDERLDAAIALNINGPSRLLQFAHDCGDAPMMHVSTTYVSGVQTGDVGESLIPAGHTVASFVAAGGDAAAVASGGRFDLDATLAELDQLVERVKSDHPREGATRRRAMIETGMNYAQANGWNDTYTFTKWVAEQRLNRDHGRCSLVIFRPAIIEGSYDEPAPGWIDGLRMADPLILAYGRGKLKEFPCDSDVALDLIPVDFVANAMIATLPAGRTDGKLEVFQCSSSGRNPVHMPEIVRFVKEAFRRRPMRDDTGRPIRVSNLSLVPREIFVSRWSGRLRRIQRLRSLLKPVKMASRFRKRLGSIEAQIAQLVYFAKIYSPYIHLSCRYLDDRLRAVYEGMDPVDRGEFPFDVSRIDWRDYIVHRHVPGVRHFVLGSGTELEAPMLAASYAVEDESPDAPPPMQILSALRGETIFDVFENAAQAFPARIALQVRRGGRWIRYTYADALSTTAAVSRRFADYHLEPGDRIAIYSENCPEWGLTYLAAIRSGLTVVPLDVQLPAADAVAMARFADVRLICAGKSTLEKTGEAIGDAEPPVSMQVVALTSPFVPPPETSRDPGPTRPTVTGDAIASIVFTSGTTVAPKGVMLRHRNFLSNARSLVHVQPVQADDQFLSVLPMHHVFEFTGGFLVPMANASTVTYVEQLSGPEIVSLIQATRTTVMMVVPKLLKMFHDGIRRGVDQSGWLTRTLFPVLGWLSDRTGGRLAPWVFRRIHQRFGGRLRMFVCGGSALPESLYHAFRRLGFAVCEGYGLTETAPVLTVNPPDGARAGSVGLPLPEIELDIRNQDPTGCGELWVRGPTVMAGYLDNEQATREILVDGWLRTGDLCRRDADGFLRVIGRTKDVIITSAGKNVYPEEVTLHFAHLPYVKELCVLAMPNPDGIGDSVDAVMVLDADAVPQDERSAVEAEIRKAVTRINERIPSYQRVQNIHFWTTELPKTTTLKVKRAEVARMLLLREHPDRVGTPATPAGGGEATEVVGSNEAWVRDLLVRVTGRPPTHVRPEANLLLDLGVDSLMRIQVLGEIETQFGMDLPEEVAARVGRVGDLLALVGDRSPVNGKMPKRTSGRAWRFRSDAAPKATQIGNGRVPLTMLPLRWVLRGGIGLMFHSYIRVEAHGLDNIPQSGAFVLAANHSSHLDSAAVLISVGPLLRRSKRRLFVAGAEDYFFNTRLKAMVFGELCDIIPFDRGADGLKGLQRCGEALRCGQPLLLFPEGTRSVTGEMQPFKIGTAVLSVEMGAPIVPVLIENAFELFPKGNRFVRPGVVTVRFGKKVSPPDEGVAADDIAARHELYREITATVQREVESLGRLRHGADV